MMSHYGHVQTATVSCNLLTTHNNLKREGKNKYPSQTAPYVVIFVQTSGVVDKTTHNLASALHPFTRVKANMVLHHIVTAQHTFTSN